MPIQFILNLLIAFLWTLLQDEDQFRFATFFAGFLVGIIIIFLMHRFFGQQFYLRRLYSIIKLVLIFNWELFQSAFLVMRHIVSPKRSEEHTSELQSRENLVCRLLLEKKN